jgi:hypothetical protein
MVLVLGLIAHHQVSILPSFSFATFTFCLVPPVFSFVTFSFCLVLPVFSFAQLCPLFLCVPGLHLIQKPPKIEHPPI